MEIDCTIGQEELWKLIAPLFDNKRVSEVTIDKWSCANGRNNTAIRSCKITRKMWKQKDGGVMNFGARRRKGVATVKTVVDMTYKRTCKSWKDGEGIDEYKDGLELTHVACWSETWMETVEYDTERLINKFDEKKVCRWYPVDSFDGKRIDPWYVPGDEMHLNEEEIKDLDMPDCEMIELEAPNVRRQTSDEDYLYGRLDESDYAYAGCRREGWTFMIVYTHVIKTTEMTAGSRTPVKVTYKEYGVPRLVRNEDAIDIIRNREGMIATSSARR